MTNATSKPVIRLIAIGDCNTLGVASEKHSHNIPRSVGDALTAAGLTTEVQNLGYTMSTSREGLMRAKLQAQHAADVLLLNFGLVDAWKTSIPGIYISYFPDNRLKKIGRKILKLIKKRLRSPWARRILPYGHVVKIGEYQSNLESIINEVRVTSPNVHVICWGSAPTCSDEERNVYLREYDEVLEMLASRYGSYVDTRSIIEKFPKDEMFLDEVHLTRKACEAVAKEISKALLAKLQPANVSP